MAYTPKTWTTGETITAAELNAIEQAASAAAAVADTANSGLASKVNSSTYTTALAGKAQQLVPTTTKTAAYTAAVGDLAVMNVAGGATALTLPTAPADKSMVGFLAVGATAAIPLTVSRGGTDTLGPSGATSVTAVLANEVTVYQYDAANTRWLAVSNVKPLAALDGRYAAYGSGGSGGGGTALADTVIAPAPTGVATTDRAALVTAIAAVPVGGVLQLQSNGSTPYAIDQALVINKPMTILGRVSDRYGTQAATYGNLNRPYEPPIISGTIIKQVTAATDAIQITCGGEAVHISGLGILFDSSIAFTNTGHGINQLPPVLSAGYEIGLSSAKWEDITVYGHDGNHYAYNLTNFIYCRFIGLRAYGGGLFNLVNNAGNGYGHFGNSTFIDCFCDLISGGTANGVTATTTVGQLNMLSFTRLQVNIETVSNILPQPTNAQKMFYAPGTNLTNYTIIQPDFESSITTCTCDFGTGNTKNIDWQAGYLIPTQSASTMHATTRGPAITLTANAGAGTSPPAQDPGTGDIHGGVIYVKTGTSTPAPGTDVATVVWPNGRQQQPRAVFLKQTGSADLGFYYNALNQTGFTIRSTQQLLDSHVYGLSYMVVF